jgi:hypothetical protein
MRKAKILLLCLCIVLSLDSAQGAFGREINSSKIASISKNEFPDIFRKIKNGIRRIFGRKQQIIACYVPGVNKINLSRTEVFASDQNLTIEILTEVSNPGSDVLTYIYEVSGGEIVGKGEKVVWNLSGVKPGTYTITASVDDGCGVCGVSRTEQIKVSECTDCK